MPAYTFYDGGARRFCLFRAAALCCAVALSVSCGRRPSPLPGPDGKITSIAHLKSLYNGYPVEIREGVSVRGLVISSDRTGNLPHSMVIEDATGGIEVKTAAGNLFEIYPQGVTVTVNCNGLTLGSYGGSPQLGFGTGDYEAGLIPAYDLEWRVADAGLPQVDIPARTLGLPELSMRYMNCWVRIADVQFAAEELGLHWGDADQTVERHLVDHAGDTLAVRVLRGAMTGTPLPQGSGFAEGILGWFNGSFNLRPVSAGHAVMNSPRF